jgi:hypothetical protein
VRHAEFASLFDTDLRAKRDVVTARIAAEVAAKPDHPDAARDVWQQALAILDDLNHPDARNVRHKLATLGL